MGMELLPAKNDDEKIKAWKMALGKFSAGIESVQIDFPGNTVQLAACRA